MTRHIIQAFAISLLTIACVSPSSETDNERKAENLVASEHASALATPQPYKPFCSICSPGMRKPAGSATAPNDEFSIILLSEFVGQIEDAWLIEYTDTTTITHYFSQSVIDDLNNTATTETIVLLEYSDTEALELVAKVAGEDLYEPITIPTGW